MHVSRLLYDIHYKLFHSGEKAFHIMLGEAKEFGESATKKYRCYHDKACFSWRSKVNVEAFHSTEENKDEQQKSII